MMTFTARKKSCGKAMFLHLSVILFTLGGGLCPDLCQGDPLYSNEQTVRILLECILVFYAHGFGY